MQTQDVQKNRMINSVNSCRLVKESENIELLQTRGLSDVNSDHEQRRPVSVETE